MIGVVVGTEPALRLLVPICPSTNNLYVTRRDGKGRAKTTAYEAWLRLAGQHLLAQRRRLIDGPVRIEIEAPVNRTRDIDNLIKPALDLLSSAGVIQDDRYVDDLRIVRTGNSGDLMTIKIWPLL